MKFRFLSISPSILIAAIILISTLLSCGRLPKPDFTYAPLDNPEAGDTLRFSNESSRSVSFEWEFGDGGISYHANPNYIYKEAGIYDVKLTAINESGENFISQPIAIKEPTILGFISYDSTGVNLLAGTTIWVYDNERDRDSLYTPIYSGITDPAGFVEFRNVDSKVYHVWAIKEENHGSWTYSGYTTPLRQNKVNWFTIPCTWNETDSEK